jgi:hypothetical protein
MKNKKFFTLGLISVGVALSLMISTNIFASTLKAKTVKEAESGWKNRPGSCSSQSFG